MKTLRVCLSSDLPVELDRLPNYLYFTYDDLKLYSGQNYLEDNFAIVDEIPEDQVYGLIYILNTDGSVHRLIDYADVTIAEIESPEQIEILQKAGTMFYVNSRHRYLDKQRRSLTLPFNDGVYELNASTKKEDVFDENTILKFNPETNRFEVYGDTTEDFIDFSKPLRGATTQTVEMEVSGPRLSGNVRLSKQINNALKVTSDGLYIPTGEYVSKSDFDQWSSEVFNIKATCEEVLARIQRELDDISELITPEYIESKVYSVLEEKFGDIRTAIDNYDEYVAQLNELENQVVNYATNNIIAARNELNEKVENYQTIDDLDGSSKTYHHEVDYYEKAKDYYNGKISPETAQALLSGLIAVLMNE
jgi:hypothetical protein